MAGRKRECAADGCGLEWAPPEIPNDERQHWNDVLDHAAVELAVTGAKVRLSPASRRAAVEVLHGKRWSQARIGEQLHCAERTVRRIYGELGLNAWSKSEISVDGRRAAA